ncbi:toxin [Streptomyces triculaminicus]|uniref:toxin n=1 Tax=Streptomyces triculaminicus TaxID=2816232 RepID=UPI0037D242CF
MEAMPVPSPFTLAAFVRAIEKVRGRRILLLPFSESFARLDAACGLWVRMPDPPIDLVFYMQGTTPYHQQKIILHELAHLWCDDENSLDVGQFQAMFPFLGSTLISKLVGGAKVRGRAAYDTYEERRAETLADFIQHAADDATHGDDTLRRLDESLSHPVARRRSP